MQNQYAYVKIFEIKFIKDETMDQALYGSIDMPIAYYVMALFLMLVTGFVCYYRKRDFSKAVVWALLVGYIFLIFSSTVITRSVRKDYDFKLKLFWSYTAIKKGKEYLLALNIANVLMLIPIGFLVSCISAMNYKKATLIGVMVSGVIEIFQLILKRGLFEFDDIFHNTLGCVAGYLIYRLYKKLSDKMR